MVCGVLNFAVRTETAYNARRHFDEIFKSFKGLPAVLINFVFWHQELLLLSFH
jgi:hypothetical protein